MRGNAIQLINYLYQYIKDEEKIFKLDEDKDKRSKSQNNYAWELIGKLADAMNMSKNEMYLQMLKDYGQSILASIKSGIEPVGIKYYEEVGKGYVKGEEFTHYRVYKGSSEFNTKEMTFFINGIIQECTNLEIPTLTMEQIKKMRLV